MNKGKHKQACVYTLKLAPQMHTAQSNKYLWMHAPATALTGITAIRLIHE